MVNLDELAVAVISIQKQIKIVLEKLEAVTKEQCPNWHHQRWLASRAEALATGRTALGKMDVLERCLRELRTLKALGAQEDSTKIG